VLLLTLFAVGVVGCNSEKKDAEEGVKQATVPLSRRRRPLSAMARRSAPGSRGPGCNAVQHQLRRAATPCGGPYLGHRDRRRSARPRSPETYGALVRTRSNTFEDVEFDAPRCASSGESSVAAFANKWSAVAFHRVTMVADFAADGAAGARGGSIADGGASGNPSKWYRTATTPSVTTRAWAT
jgi:hypothetical protein